MWGESHAVCSVRVSSSHGLTSAIVPAGLLVSVSWRLPVRIHVRAFHHRTL